MTDPEVQRCTVPIMIHEDGVPYHHDDTMVLWSWGTPLSIGNSWTSRTCITGIPTSRVCKETRQEILQVLKWDLQTLAQGVYPSTDHKGNAFPDGSARKLLAGQRVIGDYTAIFTHWKHWKGDSEAAVSAHALWKRHYRCNLICDFCWAHASNSWLSYGDWGVNARWRSTMCIDSLVDDSPWCAIKGFSRRRRLWDLLHVVHLGTLRDIIASTLEELLSTGELAVYCGLDGGADHDAVLHRFSVLAQRWAKAEGLELSIRPLTVKRLRISSKQHPELDSRIKASRARVLFEYVVKATLDIEPWSSFIDLYILLLSSFL